MEHVKYDLGNLQRGSVVVVTLRNQANVLLMDASNYRTYSSGRGGRYRYFGGLAKTSPIRLAVPQTGHWFLALDLGGYAGRIDSSVNVLPPPRGSLPAINPSAGGLHQIRHTPPVLPAAEALGGRTWDVFVSHASEDKDSVAKPLADALEAAGVTVWLDVAELRVGDSLRRKIDQGIRSSRFGVVIFSTAFFSKGWTQYELDGLVTRDVSGEQNLLPIWHDLTKDEVVAYSPSLADKFALTTGSLSIVEIAEQITDVVMGDEDVA